MGVNYVKGGGMEIKGWENKHFKKELVCWVKVCDPLMNCGYIYIFWLFLRAMFVKRALDAMSFGCNRLWMQCLNHLVVKALDSQSRGPKFKTTGWLQGRLSLSSF